jgi:asparagine synthase (glutamine-hydrolysing)
MLRDVLSRDSVQRQGIFRAEVVEPMVRDHVAGNSNYSHQLWGLLMFSLWLERRERQDSAVSAAATSAVP